MHRRNTYDQKFTKACTPGISGHILTPHAFIFPDPCVYSSRCPTCSNVGLELVRTAELSPHSLRLGLLFRPSRFNCVSKVSESFRSSALLSPSRINLLQSNVGIHTCRTPSVAGNCSACRISHRHRAEVDGLRQCH